MACPPGKGESGGRVERGGEEAEGKEASRGPLTIRLLLHSLRSTGCAGGFGIGIPADSDVSVDALEMRRVLERL